MLVLILTFGYSLELIILIYILIRTSEFCMHWGSLMGCQAWGLWRCQCFKIYWGSLWSVNVKVDDDCGADIWKFLAVEFLWFINVLLWHWQCLIWLPDPLAMFNWVSEDELGAEADIWNFLAVVYMKRSAIYAGNQWTIWSMWCAADHAFSKLEHTMWWLYLWIKIKQHKCWIQKGQVVTAAAAHRCQWSFVHSCQWLLGHCCWWLFVHHC